MSDICKRCHESGTGCCFVYAQSSSDQVGIFLDDIYIIQNHLNVEMGHFIVQDTVPDKYRKSLSTHIHPIFDKLYHNNTRYKLKIIDQKCIFLSRSGCKLPVEIRPLYCRIYPFWFSANGNIMVLSSQQCLAQSKSTLSWKVVNEHFGYSEDYLKSIFAQILIYGDSNMT
jgi:Fe-S-cluster containining protein